MCRFLVQNQVLHGLAGSIADGQAVPAPSTPMDGDQRLAPLHSAHIHSYHPPAFSNGAHPSNAGYTVDPRTVTLPGIPYPTAAHMQGENIEGGRANDGSAGSVAQQDLHANSDANMAEMNPRMQALLASLQV